MVSFIFWLTLLPSKVSGIHWIAGQVFYRVALVVLVLLTTKLWIQLDWESHTYKYNIKNVHNNSLSFDFIPLC